MRTVRVSSAVTAPVSEDGVSDDHRPRLGAVHEGNVGILFEHDGFEALPGLLDGSQVGFVPVEEGEDFSAREACGRSCGDGLDIRCKESNALGLCMKFEGDSIRLLDRASTFVNFITFLWSKIYPLDQNPCAKRKAGMKNP
jgi:hypothetical protein